MKGSRKYCPRCGHQLVGVPPRSPPVTVHSSLLYLLRTACVGVGEAGCGLPGNRRYEVEILVDVKDGQSGEFGSRSDDEVGNRRPAVLAPIRQQQLDFKSAVLNPWS